MSRSTAVGRKENHLVNQLFGTVAIINANKPTYQNTKVCLPLDTVPIH